MEQAIELECLDGTKISIDINEIFMYKEEDSSVVEEDTRRVTLPKHSVVMFRQCSIRVKTSYEQIKEKLRIAKLIY